MKLGFQTQDFVDSGGIPIEEVIETVALDGYAGIDISATHHQSGDPSLFPQEDRCRYRDLAKQFGVEIVAVVTRLPMVEAVWQGQPINLHGAVDLACDVGAGIVTVRIGSYETTGRSADLAWESAAEHLADVCNYAQSSGILIAIDGVEPDSLLDSPEKLCRFIEEVRAPNLKHNYDPCTLALAGHDPANAVKTLAPHICHAHIRDYRGSYPNHNYHIPGEGKL